MSHLIATDDIDSAPEITAADSSLSNLVELSADVSARSNLQTLLSRCSPLTHQRQSELLQENIQAQGKIRSIISALGYPVRAFFTQSPNETFVEKASAAVENDGTKISSINSRVYQQWLGRLNELEMMAARKQYGSRQAAQLAADLEIFDCAILLRMTEAASIEKPAWSPDLKGHHDRSHAMASIRTMRDLIVRNNAMLVNTNLRLVAKRAYESAGKHTSNAKLPVDDLFQEGVMGLITAIDRFDATHGTRLSTYADPRIRKNINRYIANHRTNVRVPVHIQDAHSKAFRTSVDSGTTPKPSTIHTPKHEVSLHQPVGTPSETDQTVGDRLADESGMRPDEAMNHAMSMDSLESAMNELDPVDREILLLRHGMPSAQTFVLAMIESDFANAHTLTQTLHAKAEQKRDSAVHPIRVRKTLR